MEQLRVIIVMGVAGSGKSTVGALLSARNNGDFYDADDFHPPENIAKMAAGIPLQDSDRVAWLARLRKEVINAAPAGKFSVLACSALKQIYRDQLGCGTTRVALVYLKGDPVTLAKRLAGRGGHYMKAGMLDSQLAILEEPSHEQGLTVDIANTAEEIVAAIESALGLRYFS